MSGRALLRRLFRCDVQGLEERVARSEREASEVISRAEVVDVRLEELQTRLALLREQARRARAT